MFKFSLQLVEQAPALAHLYLKSTSGDGHEQTEHHGSDLRDGGDRTGGSGPYRDQGRNGGGADHHEPAGEIERLLRPAAHDMREQDTLAPLEAQVFLSIWMIGPLIDQRRRQPVDPARRRAAPPWPQSAEELITHAHSMTYPRPQDPTANGGAGAPAQRAKQLKADHAEQLCPGDQPRDDHDFARPGCDSGPDRRGLLP